MNYLSQIDFNKLVNKIVTHTFIKESLDDISQFQLLKKSGHFDLRRVKTFRIKMKTKRITIVVTSY